MILKSLKIASQTGQKQAGIFRRLADRFSQSVKGKPESIASKGDVYDGFIIKHSLVGGRITTRVSDIGGVLLGFIDSSGEPQVSGVDNPDYLWPTFPRDIFAPEVPIPDDLEPFNYALVGLKRTQDIYGFSNFELGDDIGSQYLFTVGSINEDFDLGSATCITDTSEPSVSPETATRIYFLSDGTTQVSEATSSSRYKDLSKYVEIKPSANFAVYYRFIISKRTSPKQFNIISLTVGEDAIADVDPDYYLCPRGQRMSFVSIELRDAAFFRTPLTQVSVPASARQLGRMVGVTTVSTAPNGGDFLIASGKSGILVTFCTITNQNEPIIDNKLITSSEIFTGEARIEPWDESGMWFYEFSRSETVEGSVVNPVTVSYKFAKEPCGSFVKNFRAVGDGFEDVPIIAAKGFMPHIIGPPSLCMNHDSIDIYVDYRIARSFHDNEIGGAAFDEKTRATIQMQTGIIKISIGYEITVDGSGNETYEIGDPVSTVMVEDCSGAVSSGAFSALGGDREDYHRLYRVKWAGLVGGRSVCVASIVKHLRWHEEVPGQPLSDSKATAQSNIGRGQRFGFRQFTRYVDSGGPEPAPVDELETIGYEYQDFFCTVIDGDDYSAGVSPQPENDGSWVDSLGVAIFVDGAMSEFSCSTLGWKLIGEVEPKDIRADDIAWETEKVKICSAISDNEIVLCGYRMDDTGIDLIKIDIDTMGMVTLRTDAFPTTGSRPAIHCYQKSISGSPACMTYRLGRQNSSGGFIDLSKDSGESWTRIAVGGTPGMGATYVGSTIWGPEHGNIFG